MLTESLEEELSLLRRHLDVLRSVRREGPIGIRRLAEETGLSRSKVRYSLRVLEREGFIQPSKRGATPSDRGMDEVREGLAGVRRGISDLLEEL